MDIQELFQNIVTTTRTKNTSLLLVTTSNTVYVKRPSKLFIAQGLGDRQVKKRSNINHTRRFLVAVVVVVVVVAAAGVVVVLVACHVLKGFR